MVRANLHRRQIRHRASALLVVAGWEAYISPSRYAKYGNTWAEM
jgi:predicted FMN-binding regulatory protein PaiB